MSSAGQRHRIAVALAANLAPVVAAGCGNANGVQGGDSDGLSGGTYAFDLTVDDTSFAPGILKAQNLATVSITLRNAGAKPHDFVVDCATSSNASGPPTTWCFPDAGAIPPVAPGGSATTTFVTPNYETIYVFRSDLPGDTQAGQFVVQ